MLRFISPKGRDSRPLGWLVLLLLSNWSLPAMGQPPESVPVQVTAVREDELQQVVRITGTVTSPRDGRLSSEISGLVTALQVEAGSRVKEGDLLLELDRELAELQWRSAASAVEAARIALQDARRRKEEAQRLAPQQSIAETIVRDLAAEEAQDRAILQQAEADAGYRRALLDRHSLRAPFTGIVRRRHTELGEWVVPGSPVLELVATEQLRIDFPVAEDYLDAVSEETSVRYQLGDAGSEQRMARVVTVVPVSDPVARTFLLRAEPVADDERMVPGMSVSGELLLGTGRRGLVVPRDAIIKQADGRVIVWSMQSENGAETVIERPVRTGLAFAGMVEIREGIESGEQVVVKGNESLMSGQPVSVRR